MSELFTLKQKVHINMSGNEWFLSLLERLNSTIKMLTLEYFDYK